MAGGGDNTNIYQEASTNLMNAGGTLNTGAAIGASGALPAAVGMDLYSNPYTNDVVNTTSADILRNAERMRMGNSADAVAAGAFGGSRHGVVDSLTNEAALRTVANTSAGLRHQGFTTAAGLSGADANRRLQAGSLMGNLANTGAGIGATQFGVGRQIGLDQFNQGTTEQNIVQALLDNSSGMFNRYTNQPVDLMNFRNAALASSPLNNSSTTTSGYNPGLADYLSLGMQVAAI